MAGSLLRPLDYHRNQQHTWIKLQVDHLHNAAQGHKCGNLQYTLMMKKTENSVDDDDDELMMMTTIMMVRIIDMYDNGNN